MSFEALTRQLFEGFGFVPVEEGTMRDKDLIRLAGERDVYEVVGDGDSSKLLVNRTAALRKRMHALEDELADCRTKYQQLVDAVPPARVTRVMVTGS